MDDDENERKSRQFTTPDQKRVLEFVYQVNPRPNKKLQTYLSNTLGMTFKRVRVWFQNKRTREKTLKEPLIRSCDEIITLLTSKMATNEGFTLLPTNNLVFHYSQDGNKPTNFSTKPENETNNLLTHLQTNQLTNKTTHPTTNTIYNLSTSPSHPMNSPLHGNPPSPSISSLSDNLHVNLTLETNKEGTSPNNNETPFSDRFFTISKKAMLPPSPKNLPSIPSIESNKQRSGLSQTAPDFRNLIEKTVQKPMNINLVINSVGGIFDQQNNDLDHNLVNSWNKHSLNNIINNPIKSNLYKSSSNNNQLNVSQHRINNNNNTSNNNTANNNNNSNSNPANISNLINNPVNIFHNVNNPFSANLSSDNPFNNNNNNVNSLLNNNNNINNRIGGINNNNGLSLSSSPSSSSSLTNGTFPLIQSISPIHNISQPFVNLLKQNEKSNATLPPISIPSSSSLPSSSTLTLLSSSPSSSSSSFSSSSSKENKVINAKYNNEEEESEDEFGYLSDEIDDGDDSDDAHDFDTQINKSNNKSNNNNGNSAGVGSSLVINNDDQNEKDEEMAKRSELISAIINLSEEEVINFLLKEKQNNNQENNNVEGNALHYAAKKGFSKVVKRLILSGASPATRDPLFYTALHYAAKFNHLKVICLLIKYGSPCSSMNDHGKTPLHLATEFGHVGAMELLLKADSDPNARDLYGDSPLHISTRAGNVNATKILLDYRARLDNINIKNGYCPLHELPASNVVHSTKLSIFKLFLNYIEEEKKDMLVNMRTLQRGETVLHLATKNSTVDLIECLIANHCNLKATDFNGKTPLDTAVEANNFQAIDLLIKEREKMRISQLLNSSTELRATI